MSSIPGERACATPRPSSLQAALNERQMSTTACDVKRFHNPKEMTRCLPATSQRLQSTPSTAVSRGLLAGLRRRCDLSATD